MARRLMIHMARTLLPHRPLVMDIRRTYRPPPTRRTRTHRHRHPSLLLLRTTINLNI